MIFNNGVWIIVRLQGEDHDIPEDPFEVFINGKPKGTTKLLAFQRHVPNTDQFPQVLALYSSGYLRLKAGADPNPPLPFGQSLVLGPAIFGTSTSYPSTTLFSNPQLQSVAIDTTQINKDGTNRLLIEITASASDSKLLPDSTKIKPKTNRIMNLTWTLTLDEPSDQETMLDVAGKFEFTEDVIPDLEKTAEAQSVRLLQISTMYIDSSKHDVNAFRFRNSDGVVTIYYDPALANSLLPVNLSSLDPETLIFDSLHTDDVGQPNGNTPCYRIMIDSTAGFQSGPITVRAIFNSSQNLNHDNLGLWAFQQPPERIERGRSGSINYTVVASTDPLRTIGSDLDNACRYHDRGRALFNRKQYNEAIEQYQKAIHFKFDFVKAYDSWGWALADQGLYGDAILVFKEAIKINEKYAEAYNSWGWALANQGHYDDAILVFKEAIKINAKYADAYNSWGLALTNQEHFDDAILVFKEAIKINAKYAEAYNSWGWALTKQMRHEEAIEQYQKATETNPAYAQAYDSLGWELSKQKRYDEAITSFRKSIYIRPNNERYNCLGFALTNQGHYDEAIEEFEKATIFNPKYAEAYNNWGWALGNQGLYPDAFKKFEKAIESNPKNANVLANAYNNWGWALAHERRYDEAIEKYHQAIHEDNNYVYAYHNCAMALWDQGKYNQGCEKWKETRRAYELKKQDAINRNDSNFFYCYGSMLHEIFGDIDESEKAYKEGLELDHHDTLIHIGLTYLYLKKKDEIRMEKCSWATILRRSSADPLADAYWHARNAYRRAENLIMDQKKKKTASLFLLQQLAELHLAMEEYAKARQILDEILENNQEHVSAHAALGILYVRQENFKTAIQHFEIATRLDPHNLTIRCNLAEAYRNDGQLPSAEVEYKRILSVAPDHAESHIGLGEVYTAMGDPGEDSDLYDHAVCHFDLGIKIATNRTENKLAKKKLAAAYYSSGYAKVKLYEAPGAIRDESLMHKALRDFKNCFDNDLDHHKAKLAQEKLQKRLNRFGSQRFAETMAPWIIFLSSMFVFIAIQIHFFYDGGIIKEHYGDYALLTFGSLLLTVAGLFLPHILKLKIGTGGIELEKSPVDQITTLSSLGIKSQSGSNK